jgi:hypothetical protein
VLGDPDNPAHVRVFDSSGKTKLAQIVLTEDPPKKPSDIQWYRTKSPPEDLKNKIITFASSDYLPYKKYKLPEMSNWDVIVNQWIIFYEG